MVRSVLKAAGRGRGEQAQVSKLEFSLGFGPKAAGQVAARRRPRTRTWILGQVPSCLVPQGLSPFIPEKLAFPLRLGVGGQAPCLPRGEEGGARRGVSLEGAPRARCGPLGSGFSYSGSNPASRFSPIPTLPAPARLRHCPPPPRRPPPPPVPPAGPSLPSVAVHAGQSISGGAEEGTAVRPRAE